MGVRGPRSVVKSCANRFNIVAQRSLITEKKKCWFQTLRNNSQQHATIKQQEVQTDAACNIQQCWELLTNSAAPFAWGLSAKRTKECRKK